MELNKNTVAAIISVQQNINKDEKATNQRRTQLHTFSKTLAAEFRRVADVLNFQFATLVHTPENFLNLTHMHKARPFFDCELFFFSYFQTMDR